MACMQSANSEYFFHADASLPQPPDATVSLEAQLRVLTYHATVGLLLRSSVDRSSSIRGPDTRRVLLLFLLGLVGDIS